MENWTMELAVERQILTKVQIQRDIFQRDSLLRVLFVKRKIPQGYILGKSQLVKD